MVGSLSTTPIWSVNERFTDVAALVLDATYGWRRCVDLAFDGIAVRAGKNGRDIFLRRLKGIYGEVEVNGSEILREFFRRDYDEV